jgi:hypothetical protein
MRVVRSHHDPCAAEARFQVRHQPVQRFGHVAVAQIPRIHLAAKHRAVVFFRVPHQSRILFRRKEVILGALPVAMRVLPSPSLQNFARF